jgi:hypothetical protein
MLADQLNRPVEEFLQMGIPDIRRWIAYLKWKGKKLDSERKR